MGGEVAGKFLVEAGGLPEIFFRRGIGGGLEDGERGGGLARVVPDELGPCLGSGF